jgi:hypothetical protein
MNDLEHDLLEVLRKYRDKLAPDRRRLGEWVGAAYTIGKLSREITRQWEGSCQLATGDPDFLPVGESFVRNDETI